MSAKPQQILKGYEGHQSQAMFGRVLCDTWPGKVCKILLTCPITWASPPTYLPLQIITTWRYALNRCQTMGINEGKFRTHYN